MENTIQNMHGAKTQGAESSLMRHWRALLAIVAGVLILALVNWSIYQRERLIADGQMVLLQLAPVDPRSLMQGDYVALSFAVANELWSKRYASKETEDMADDGLVVLRLDEKNVGHFERLEDGAPLQANEVRLHYRVRDGFGGRVRIATNAFFFEEGQGALYEKARYGEFRVDASGEAILTQLRDEQLAVLGRSAVLE